jgi:antitoxin VapB
MRVVIDDPTFEAALRELAEAIGEPESVLIQTAVKEKLERVRRAKSKINWDTIHAIQERVAQMPVLDDRSADELIGYNEFGTFD